MDVTKLFDRCTVIRLEDEDIGIQPFPMLDAGYGEACHFADTIGQQPVTAECCWTDVVLEFQAACKSDQEDRIAVVWLDGVELSPHHHSPAAIFGGQSSSADAPNLYRYCLRRLGSGGAEKLYSVEPHGGDAIFLIALAGGLELQDHIGPAALRRHRLLAYGVGEALDNLILTKRASFRFPVLWLTLTLSIEVYPVHSPTKWLFQNPNRWSINSQADKSL
nr:peptide-N4-(N-acetyl-beta-glucosaminyl) asparagine amidase A-like [Ipomoea batatas]GME13684.1 peptide-N4-(N-acetyl-beta-glucosaminyl) asparagine amidase A-like [Ipomoea batatas]